MDVKIIESNDDTCKYQISEDSEIDETSVIDSPYFHDTVLEEKVEHFTEQNITEKMHSMFPDKKMHMNTLVRLYKFIFDSDKVKANWEKSSDDVLEDIISSGFSLDISKLMDNQNKNIMKQFLNDKMFYKKISAIPVFIDFAYIYYMYHYDKDSPVYKLPSSIFKFRLFAAVVRADDYTLNDCFEECITNNFISDLRIEEPPFHLRTELSKQEIKEKIEKIVKPICKKIMESLLKLRKEESRLVVINKQLSEYSENAISPIEDSANLSAITDDINVSNRKDNIE